MVLDVQNITKVFLGKKKTKIYANDDISFKINEGEIFGLMGHNGAGKTTLVNQIIGSTKPTSGNIFLKNENVQKSPTKARGICSVQSQSQLPLGFLTPAQAVSTMGKMRLANKEDVQKRMNYLFDALDIGQWANTEGIQLSGGIKRLTAFCMSVISPGELVILDEPTNDVDPMRRRYLWDIIRQLTKDGTSVILVTHNVLEAEKAVDRLAILHKGKFLVEGTPSQIKSSVDNKMRLEVNLINENSLNNLPEWIINKNTVGNRLIMSLDSNSVPLSIEWASEQVRQNHILDYTLSPTTLEDVYVELTSGKGE
ncbi:ABC transporter ATP-binding protein [Shouchella hunanensis]|uniref:ABC transporter ATP-binding protein n=1 Tax=Shouchella hunanensis TaxID=766894 RepID=A0ABY7W5M8_9BACI|nr:ABC transporter ATP-binding protein [Shouchella hunanensis]WDF02025.1 ABC transporter ATP-binding protein [Shouchella hunanensis]